MPTILDRIVVRKREEVAAAKLRVPVAELERRLADAPPVRDFLAALRAAAGMAVIAEVKHRSPSAGVIREPFDPAAIAKAYAANGAACLSVLTDEQFFGGHLDHLRAARAVVPLPVLRKEFVLDPYQLVEARAAGADAALLIAECLPGGLLAELLAVAGGLGLTALVELHDAEQAERVVAAGATLIGVNNRDLRTFETRLEHTLELRSRIPADRLLVSESGIRTPADIRTLRANGVRAVLVGESLLRQPDPGEALRRLLADK